MECIAATNATATLELFRTIVAMVRIIIITIGTLFTIITIIIIIALVGLHRLIISVTASDCRIMCMC